MIPRNKHLSTSDLSSPRLLVLFFVYLLIIFPIMMLVTFLFSTLPWTHILCSAQHGFKALLFALPFVKGIASWLDLYFPSLSYLLSLLFSFNSLLFLTLLFISIQLRDSHKRILSISAYRWTRRDNRLFLHSYSYLSNFKYLLRELPAPPFRYSASSYCGCIKYLLYYSSWLL
jgi:hypothetical protein